MEEAACTPFGFVGVLCRSEEAAVDRNPAGFSLSHRPEIRWSRSSTACLEERSRNASRGRALYRIVKVYLRKTISSQPKSIISRKQVNVPSDERDRDVRRRASAASHRLNC
ncbi:hypothetical protein F2P81_003566 [Scophthalmus maximus]|uniref:Uncharacterized protein n=1 Tax=Scophthalmus maximus TaxID=52904 RepID=A0A6A4TIU1_SCOMX|nr:hypothetical protein F2P81_003566 [Scophthalmus maximus]